MLTQLFTELCATVLLKKVDKTSCGSGQLITSS